MTRFVWKLFYTTKEKLFWIGNWKNKLFFLTESNFDSIWWQWYPVRVESSFIFIWKRKLLPNCLWHACADTIFANPVCTQRSRRAAEFQIKQPPSPFPCWEHCLLVKTGMCLSFLNSLLNDNIPKPKLALSKA